MGDTDYLTPTQVNFTIIKHSRFANKSGKNSININTEALSDRLFEFVNISSSTFIIDFQILITYDQKRPYFTVYLEYKWNNRIVFLQLLRILRSTNNIIYIVS